MKNKKHGGTALMLAGLVLLACAAALTFVNIRRQNEAGEEAVRVLSSLQTAIVQSQEPETASDDERVSVDESIPPEARLMPSCPIDGEEYIGVLQIPKLGLELPVLKEWSMPLLQQAPCLYYGSVYTRDMVICAHNYSTHFGRLTELSVGDELLFFGADGQLHSYVVAEFETLAPTDVEYMTDGEWPLTLFTCTWGGRSRVTVRCEEA